ncbi:ABC transporter ATP-binding protein [Acuticoccus sediminis]|uniref:ABC transporter ATP-binding protein n=1 Tax=Acuticoccus sediminis TaxID=2184697 RepID=A0A8B2NEI5_9HYPH|nr:ABC transporter ATP-binding protein [Acuticoccus sediminis]RAH97277.1 ABC transporter ATP-binding protein [Acuticoccus sediminis]
MTDVLDRPAATTAKLALEDITSGYGNVEIIKSLSLGVRPGEIFALMGKNGMGKTTLLKTIVGLLPARRGRILLDGADVTKKGPKTMADAGVAYAPQEQPLFQDLSIRDNLRLALRSDRALAEGLERVYGHFPFLADRLAQKAGTLSGGEQKMLIIARAMMTAPKLLLIDEISEGLQPTVIERIAAALRDERANGTTVLIVEQHLAFALSIADRWAVMKLGQIDDAGEIGPDTEARMLEHLRI